MDINKRILAVRHFIGSFWPHSAAMTAVLEDGVPLGGTDHYDALCMSCIRTLQREGFAVLAPKKQEVILCGGGTFIGLPQFTGFADRLGNLISAVEWAKARKEKGKS